MKTITKTTKASSTELMTTKGKVENLLALDKISLKDIDGLSNLERAHLGEVVTEKLEKLRGEERDSFLEKIAAVVPSSTKSQLWEHNQLVISRAITNFMCKHGCMPPKTVIANECGLSRQTVIKHMKEYQVNPEHMSTTEQFKFMAPQVLASVFKSAVNGDARSARLYFEMVGELNKPHPNTASTVVNEQNNYIQINNTILSQENLRQLSAEQLNQIESIITKREVR